ncbi:PQQ-dependent sugar dehydrogenase [Aquisalimonas sp.]|uniref:PQQ-dependent sugar dehydrogenase n=1 Tax=Aquisalimonas sp. TaxID=1872621 RepID=UPI0025C06E56|nr:PQQ-dependent sugar dehydrogenase [Aquisalimonas sp.]
MSPTQGTRLVVLLLGGLLMTACINGSDEPAENAETPDYEVETVVTGLENPWGLTFLTAEDGNKALVTERPGRLQVVDLDAGEMSEVKGVPAVASGGQGGLLDVALYPDYGPGQEWVYLTYAAEGDDGGQYATHLGRGRLDLGGMELVDFEVLHVAEPFTSGTGHFGSRMVFDEEWKLYVTVGDRRQRDAAQDLSSHWGKTLRLRRDGSIPDDNPFVDDVDALDAVYTYGHRNVQGMTVDPATGLIWQNEHGQQNGDEINILDQPGGNYGWPVATYGREYGSGRPIGDLPPERDDTVDPVYHWDGTRYDHGQQGFPPSGMAFYQGDAFPQWQGDLFMGNLAHQYLGRFEVRGREVVKEHRMLAGRGWRIRDVRVHPDSGQLYVLVDAPDAPLLRVRPAP